MPRDDERFAIEESAKLDDVGAARLEDDVRQDPSNLDARLALISYYFDPGRTEDNRSRHADHVLWLIANAPTSNMFRSPYACLFRWDSSFERAEAAWDAHLARHDVDPRILLNAASFFTISSPEKSRACLERGEGLRPDWRSWSDELGHMSLRKASVARELRALGGTTARPLLEESACQQEAERSLGHFERSLALCQNDADRFSVLADAITASVECRDHTKSELFAAEILRLAPSNTSDRHWRDHVHRAYVARGHAALSRSDIVRAASDLLEAGRIGSEDAPILRSFGPDFALARLLLERGEVSPVIAYLDECKRFWNEPRINRWREALARGEKPHLHRGFDPAESG